MQELVDILYRNRRDLVDDVAAQVAATRPKVDQVVLRGSLERLFDDLIELMGSGTLSAMRDQQTAIASWLGFTLRTALGEFSMADFVGTSYFIVTPALRKVVEREGADFAPLEPVLMRITIAAAEAYSDAYQARLLELQEQRLSREAEAERLRATSHLVMGVAHELNTPLEIINHAAELVARDGSDDIREAAELIRSNVTRASQLIRRFRSLSVGESEDAIQPVDVADTVADAMVLYRRTSVHEPKIDIHVVDELGHAEGDTRWHGYPLYFTHVLLNLFSNAEHHAYRDAGGPVEIVLERHDDRLNVTVADRGIGITKRDLDSVLHPFFTTGRSRGRTGLGMAVVYNLVTAGMHGTLDINSQVGVGTRVLLDLPWRPISANSEGRDRVISR